MEAQVTRLKINATNLKNSLVGYNKQLSKLRLEERRLTFNAQRNQVQKQKEAKIEKKGGIGSSLNVIQSKILSGPLGFFDKAKEFFGVVLLGLLINNLPRIIEQLKTFFSENGWLIDTIKFTLSIIGKGIMGMIYLVDEYPAAVMKRIDNERKWVAGEIDKVVAIAQGAYSVWDKFLNGPEQQPVSGTGGATGGPIPRVNPPTPQASSGGSTASPNPQSPIGNQPQKFNKGGTVGPGESSNAPKFRGVNPTPAGRKAIESIKAFDNFSQVALQTELNAQILSDRDGINETFNKVNSSFETFLKFFKDSDKDSLDMMDPSSSRGFGDPFASFTPVDVSSEDVVGRIGSTGRSTGPHLHIETGDGYSGKGGKLSESILNGVFLGGVPLKNIARSAGLGDGRNHQGFDYAAPSGTPITLGTGLKFVEYDAGDNAGYGNTLIILDANGNKFLLGHLSGGPSAEALEKIKKAKKKVNPVAAKASDLTKTLQDAVDLSDPVETTTVVMSQMFVQPTPILYPVIQKVGSAAVNMFNQSNNTAFSFLR